jgi:hypothetical protein
LPFITERAKKYGIEGFTELFAESKHIDLIKTTYSKYAELIRATSTERISKQTVINWMDIYEPRAGGATHCVLMAHMKKPIPIWKHNALDLFSTFEIYQRCKEYGWLK